MRPGGKEGFLYGMTFGAEISAAGALPAAGFYLITGKAAEGSGIPAADSAITDGSALGVGHIFYGKTTHTLVSGDKVKPITLTLLCFASDNSETKSKSKTENTTQCDVKNGTRSYVEGALAEKTGSISGYYEVGSAAQEEIERRFDVVVRDDGTKITRLAIKKGIWPLMLSRRETTEVGEEEVWEYMPCIIDQVTQTKPMDGNQEFSCNYTIDGKENPFVYKRKITA